MSVKAGHKMLVKFTPGVNWECGTETAFYHFCSRKKLGFSAFSLSPIGYQIL